MKCSNSPKISTPELELAVVEYFNYRRHIIVPNISWGLQMQECDLLVITSAGCAYEIELKISRADLLADKKKHGTYRNPSTHNEGKVHRLYFAVPEYMLKDLEHVPSRAGVIVARYGGHGWRCELHREARIDTDVQKFDDKRLLALGRLGCMRIWTLKKSLVKWRHDYAGLEMAYAQLSVTRDQELNKGGGI